MENKFLTGPLWGELRLFRVVSRRSGAKNFFKIGQIFTYLSYLTLLYFLILDCSIFDPLTATEMSFCVNLWPKCHKLFPLVSD
jgi:hypothetical protein